MPGFDQAPDFITPDEYAPAVVIEAKITNDDGTARDKFTRIIHLVEQSRQRIAGGARVRGDRLHRRPRLRHRREDMRRSLVALEGKVFTLATLKDLVASTGFGRFAS